MEVVEKKLVRNFLSSKTEKNTAIIWSLGTLFLCLAMSSLYWHHPIGEWLAASPEKVFGGKEYWRLFTSSFIHGDLAHYLSNSIMLGVMGYYVAYHFKSIMFPITSFLVGILINLIVIWNFPPSTSLVGASGIVYYLWGFWLVLYLNIQKHVPLNRRFMKITGVGIMVLAPTEFRPQVSYYAHGIGLLLGVIIGILYYFFNKKRIHQSEVWRTEIKYVDDELIEEALSSQKTLH